LNHDERLKKGKRKKKPLASGARKDDGFGEGEGGNRGKGGIMR